MGRHSMEGPDTEITPVEAAQSRRPEPVAIAAAVQAVLAAGVTIGWVTLDDATVNTICTVIAGAASLMCTAIARSKVTPVSDPMFYS